MQTCQVAKIPPAVPIVIMYALDTARAADPAALLIPHDKKPGPPGNAPMVTKKIPRYLNFRSLYHRSNEKPAIQCSVNAAR
jgi:hypothetical protein